MANFKGFKQVSLETYQQTSDENKKNYLWLVREMSGDTVIHSAIYFGTRLYAEVNDGTSIDQRVAGIIASLGEAVDENGEWVGFLPLVEHELLGNSGITNVTDALSVLEAAILANADAIGGIQDKVAVSAETFTEAEEMGLGLGQIVYVVDQEIISGNTYLPGAYIKTPDGLKKLDSTDPSADATLEDRVGGLESRIGNEPFKGESLTAAIAEMQNTHNITGDDVEE